MTACGPGDEGAEGQDLVHGAADEGLVVRLAVSERVELPPGTGWDGSRPSTFRLLVILLHDRSALASALDLQATTSAHRVTTS